MPVYFRLPLAGLTLPAIHPFVNVNRKINEQPVYGQVTSSLYILICLFCVSVCVDVLVTSEILGMWHHTLYLHSPYTDVESFTWWVAQTDFQVDMTCDSRGKPLEFLQVKDQNTPFMLHWCNLENSHLLEGSHQQFRWYNRLTGESLSLFTVDRNTVRTMNLLADWEALLKWGRSFALVRAMNNYVCASINYWALLNLNGKHDRSRRVNCHVIVGLNAVTTAEVTILFARVDCASLYHAKSSSCKMITTKCDRFIHPFIDDLLWSFLLWIQIEFLLRPVWVWVLWSQFWTDRHSAPVALACRTLFVWSLR